MKNWQVIKQIQKQARLQIWARVWEQVRGKLRERIDVPRPWAAWHLVERQAEEDYDDPR